MFKQVFRHVDVVLALMVGFSFLALACLGIFNNYTPVPFWDMWERVVFFGSRVADNDLSAFLEPHNNHRIFLSNLLFYIDQIVFGGGYQFLFVMNGVLLLGVVGVLVWLANVALRGDKRRSKLVWLLAGLCTAICFSWTQKQNLAWAFQSQMYFVQIFPLTAMLAMYRVGTSADHKNEWFALSVATAFVSPYTMMSGLVVLPLVVAMGCYLRIGWVRLAIFVLASAASIALFLFGYRDPSAVGGQSLIGEALTDAPSHLVFALTLIGGPIYYFPGGTNLMWPLAIGLAIVATSLALVLRLIFSHSTRSLGVLFLLLFIYEGITAIGISAGRSSEFGPEYAVTSRYMTTSLVTWSLLVILIVTNFRNFFARPIRGAILLLPMVVLAPFQASAMEPAIWSRLQQLGAALAIELNVRDARQIEKTILNMDQVFPLTEQARAENTSVFGRLELAGAYELIGTNRGQTSFTGHCTGRVFETLPVAGDTRFLQILGDLQSQSGAIPAALVIQYRNKVVGYAVTSQPITSFPASQPGRAQFVGYVAPEAVGDDLRLEGRQAECAFTASTASTDSIQGDFTSLADWRLLDGSAPRSDIMDGLVSVGPMGGVLSRQSLPAVPGQRFVVDYSSTLVAPPTNGKPAHYVVGPMFTNAAGDVLYWGNVELPLIEPTRIGRVEASAPPGTTRAHLYMGGMWAQDLNAPNGKIGYGAARLSLVDISEYEAIEAIMNAQESSEIVGIFTSSSAWQGPGGAASPSGLAEDRYVIDAMNGAVSRRFLPATSGQKFSVEYTVKLERAPTNGKPPLYVVGAMFLDSQGQILSWGSVEEPIIGPTRSRRIEATAPANAARVHLYIGGMWSADIPPPNGQVAYTTATLKRISTAE
jgi:hypothetical protein